MSVAAAVLGVVAALAGPAAYAAQTISTAHTGSIPSAGPASATGGGIGAGPFGRGGSGTSAGRGGPGGFANAGTPPGNLTAGRGVPTSKAHGGSAASKNLLGPGAAANGGAKAGSSSGGFGGGGMGTEVSSALAKALEQDAGRYRWVAATSGSQSAASIELATGGDPVMAIGGFNGEGGKLSLAAFKEYVAKGDIHYYIASSGGGGGMPGGGSTTESITSWVKAHYKAETIGGQTVYDLTKASRDAPAAAPA